MTIKQLNVEQAKVNKIDPETLEVLKTLMMECIKSDHWRRKKRMIAFYEKLSHLND